VAVAGSVLGLVLFYLFSVVLIVAIMYNHCCRSRKVRDTDKLKNLMENKRKADMERHKRDIEYRKKIEEDRQRRWEKRKADYAPPRPLFDEGIQGKIVMKMDPISPLSPRFRLNSGPTPIQL